MTRRIASVWEILMHRNSISDQSCLRAPYLFQTTSIRTTKTPPFKRIWMHLMIRCCNLNLGYRSIDRLNQFEQGQIQRLQFSWSHSIISQIISSQTENPFLTKALWYFLLYTTVCRVSLLAVSLINLKYFDFLIWQLIQIPKLDEATFSKLFTSSVCVFGIHENVR